MSIIAKGKPLLEEMRALLRRQGYAYGAEDAYCDWVRRFVKFSKVQKKSALFKNTEKKVEKYLTYLALQKKVAPSTQNQALNALVFLYTKVLKQPLEGVNAARSRKEPRILVVLSKTEAVHLRVQDIDFEFKQITVRDGKGKKDRVTPLANNLIVMLQTHLEKIKIIHNKDLKDGFGSVYLPYALNKKYPNADKIFNWQYVFPSRRIATDPRTNIKRRHHVDQFVIHLLRTCCKQIQIFILFGHYLDMRIYTAMIYRHVLKQGGQDAVSSLGRL